MQVTQDTYPVFEANQVLTNRHLNELFSYLDEQERLTRANLIGIGIVCGLEIRFDAATQIIHLSKGCGITSAGYLIVQPDDAQFVAYRAIAASENPDYDAFQYVDKTLNPPETKPYELWELFEQGEPNVTPINTPSDFLDNKVVLLFLELKNTKLRNCIANNCDDKGAEVNVTLRPLLIQQNDAVAILKKANQSPETDTTSDLETKLLARLNLPDLRLPRYDVPNTSPATSNDVLAGFLTVFQAGNVVTQLGDALSAAYAAFRPMLSQTADPFADFKTKFRFLEQAPTTTEQVRFLPYFYDFFDDLIHGYDEFCKVGIELLCACCPSEALFRQHLMAGLVKPTTNAAVYRHSFVASSAVSGCEEQEKTLRQLFQRLVEMVAQFTLNPSLPKPSTSVPDNQIRITPSKLSDVPLSEKAIPYYYVQSGTPPLFQLWNAEKTRRNRANQNLSYRAGEYVPAAPAFVTDPLRYDLEYYNFLRIEGHLGKNYQSVLSTLLTLKNQYRLPIEVIALRTGAFDERIDIGDKEYLFSDLNLFYKALREEFRLFLAKELAFFYGLPVREAGDNESISKSRIPLLKTFQPALDVRADYLGGVFENDYLNGTFQADLLAIKKPITNSSFYPIAYYITKIDNTLSENIYDFEYKNLENVLSNFTDLLKKLHFEFDKLVKEQFDRDPKIIFRFEEIDDRLDVLLFNAKQGAFEQVYNNYKEQQKAIKQKLFLSNFLQTNPGIQHKAGVPIGGTFILVYHDDPDPVIKATTSEFLALRTDAVKLDLEKQLAQETASTKQPFSTELLAKAFSRISKNQLFTDNDDIRLVLGTLLGKVPPKSTGRPPVQESASTTIIRSMVDGLADGTVIADFYLPYRVAGEGGVQFVLPKAKPSFTYEIGCTNENNQAEVTLKPQGGVPPYSVKVDADDYIPLDATLLLVAGSRTLIIQDAETTESNPQTIQITNPLVLGKDAYICSEDSSTSYIVVFGVSGGKAPYTANRGTVVNGSYTSNTLTGDTDTEITITDSRGCSATKIVNYVCLPPLDFSVQIGCTTPNNEAPVTILPTGGTPSYLVQVDQGEPMAVGEPIMLSSGTHQLSVSDRIGASITKTTNVPTALTLSVDDANFRCEDGKYQALVRIEGGVPPYFVIIDGEKQLIESNVLITDLIASGNSTTITIADNNPANCDPATLTIQHTCPEPCNLPCEGKSQRCSYRLWVQPPVESKYETYRSELGVKVRFNGKEFILTDSLIPVTASDFNERFHDTIGSIIKKLNKDLNEALTASFGENRLVITYEGEEKPFATLRIEYFVCDTFRLDFSYTVAKPSPTFSLLGTYTNEPLPTGEPFNGFIMSNNRLHGKQTLSPAFDCSARDQCKGTDYSKLCEGPMPELAINLQRAQELSFHAEGKVSNMTDNEIIAWIWEIPGSRTTEPFYQGQKIDFQVQRPSGNIRLTAISRKGCFGIIEQPLLQ